MNRELPADAIRLIPVEGQQAEYYRLFILSSLALATLAGFVLGFHIPLGRLLDWQSEARRPDIIQVHGQVQLLGFAGLFVMGMSLRMMPRFASTHLQFEWLVGPVWGLVVGSLIMKAFVMVWVPDEAHSALAIGTQFTLLLAASGYFLVVFGTLLIDTHRLEGTSWFFLVGASFFLLQAVLGLFIANQEGADDTRVFSYVPNMALLYLQLGGFLMAFVAGVATRALPTMVGRARPEAGSKRAAALLACSVALVAAPLVWIEYHGYGTVLVSLSDLGLIGLGLSLIIIAGLAGVLWPAANRLRPASQPHLRLVKMAFVWLAVAGTLAVYFGSSALISGKLPSFFQLDALRHSIALGTLTPLILGMALMIVPEFAGQRQGANRQALLSTVLLVTLSAASILRVVPSLFAMDLDQDIKNGLMAIAGVLAELALVVFAVSLLRLVLAQRRAPF